MTKQSKSNDRSNDERGLVSFMITIVMMVVISLIVIGFTQVANRNRRQALDRQLSTQAFYAAESGINAAVTAIRADQAAGQPIARQTTCTGSDYPATTLNASPLVRYTCVLVNPTVPDLHISPTTQSSSVVPVNPVDGSTGAPVRPTELTFSWAVSAGQDPNPSLCSTPGVFRPTPPGPGTESCGYSLLRVDLLKQVGDTSSGALAGNTSTFYLQPVSSGASDYTFGDSAGRTFASTKANRVAASCSASTRRCTATILLDGSTSHQRYVARVTGLYREPRDVIIDARRNTTNLSFSDAQVVVDVTGKAQDVLRRVRATVPLHTMGSENIPLGGATTSATVCKRFTASGVQYDLDDPIHCP